MLDQEELTWLQRGLKELLFDFDDFCKQHDIAYQMTFGTLLGAIRHQGFIPWDDDVDVLMTYEELEKFQKLQKEFPKNWRLEQHRHKGIYKLFDENQIRPWSGSPIAFDIFLIQETGSAGVVAKRWQNFIRNRNRCSSFSLRKGFINLIKNPLRFWMNCLIARGDRSMNKNCWRYTEEIMKFSVFPQERLFPSRLYSFEGRDLPGPQDAHWCLAHEYGEDYMTPLPPNLRKSHNKKTLESANTCSEK